MMKVKALLIASSILFANMAFASNHCTWYIQDRGWCTPYFPASSSQPAPKKTDIDCEQVKQCQAK
ncbi:hypothetical protein JCM19237_5438 [Photobacterium aphoticum]|uniref:YARHG domain-containing protein n=1 Tax=Photobacterium aphoticum TaxID=754436 RepID=A0A090QHF2_9GAMM|nr:hypothetical protein JCM19237_5438 [Photobacterium aphoticum]